MSLIDKYLPAYDFEETHCCEVAASPDAVMETAAAYQPGSDAITRVMIALRELPMRISGLLFDRKAPQRTAFGLHDFVMLERRNGQDLVYGLIGQFWKSNYGLVGFSDGEAFRSFNEPGIAKLVLGFSAASTPTGKTILTTKTRVFCPDRMSRRKFLPYWYLIRPVSGLIRKRTLASIKKACEQSDLALRASSPKREIV